MSIDIHLRARRGVAVSEDEMRAVQELVDARNASRPLPAQDEPTLWGLSIADLSRPWRRESAERARARGELPTVLDVSAQLPPTREWEAARRLLLHWCDTFAELRGTLANAEWDANVDDFVLAWNDATQTYALPLGLTEAAWKTSVDFTLGLRR